MKDYIIAALAWSGGVGCLGIFLLVLQGSLLAALGLSFVTMLFGVATLQTILREE